MKRFFALFICVIVSLFLSNTLSAQAPSDENFVFDENHVGPVRIGDNYKDAAAKFKSVFPVVKTEFDNNRECTVVRCYDKKNKLQLEMYCGPHNLSHKDIIEEYMIYSADFISADGFSMNSPVKELLNTGRWFGLMDCCFILTEGIYYYIPDAYYTEDDDITAPAKSKPTVISNMPWN